MSTNIYTLSPEICTNSTIEESLYFFIMDFPYTIGNQLFWIDCHEFPIRIPKYSNN